MTNKLLINYKFNEDGSEVLSTDEMDLEDVANETYNDKI